METSTPKKLVRNWHSLYSPCLTPPWTGCFLTRRHHRNSSYLYPYTLNQRQSALYCQVRQAHQDWVVTTGAILRGSKATVVIILSFCICCGSILSLVQILFPFVLYSLSYITIPEAKENKI